MVVCLGCIPQVKCVGDFVTFWSFCPQIKMLNSLASYLLGYPAAAETAAEAEPAQTASASAATAATPVLSAQVPSVEDVELFTKEADDDWLLIEKNGTSHIALTFNILRSYL